MERICEYGRKYEEMAYGGIVQIMYAAFWIANPTLWFAYMIHPQECTVGYKLKSFFFFDK